MLSKKSEKNIYGLEINGINQGSYLKLKINCSRDRVGYDRVIEHIWTYIIANTKSIKLKINCSRDRVGYDRVIEHIWAYIVETLNKKSSTNDDIWFMVLTHIYLYWSSFFIYNIKLSCLLLKGTMPYFIYSITPPPPPPYHAIIMRIFLFGACSQLFAWAMWIDPNNMRNLVLKNTSASSYVLRCKYAPKYADPH